MNRWLVGTLTFSLMASALEAEPRRDGRGDVLPDGAIARLGTERFRHGLRVEGLAFASDGKTLYTATTYGGVHVWDVATGRRQQHFPGGTNHCQALLLSPDGQTLAVACGYHAVELWDAPTGTKRQPLPKDAYDVRHMAFSHDGRWLALRSSTGLKLWNVAKQEWHDHIKELDSEGPLSFSADDRVLAVALKDRLCLWDIAKRQERRHLRDGGAAHGRHLYGAFAPKGDTLAVWGYDDGSVRLFDATGEKERHRFPLPAKSTAISAWGWASSIGVQFAPEGQTVAFFRSDHQKTLTNIEVRDVATGKLRHEFACEPLHAATLLRFAPDGKTLASAGGYSHKGDHAVHLWDLTTGRENSVGPAHGSALVALAITPDGRHTATASRDGIVHVWETTTSKHVLRVALGDRPDVRFSRDGQRLHAWAGRNLRIVELRTGKELLNKTLDGEQHIWSSLHPDERFAYSVEREQRIAYTHDLTTKKIVHEDKSSSFYSHSPRLFAADGNLAVTLGGELFTLAKRAVVHQAMRHGSGGVFSADGRYFVTPAVPHYEGLDLRSDPPLEEVAVVDVSAQREKRMAQVHGKDRSAKHVDAATISADGQFIATAHSGDTLTLWERETGLERGHFVGHRGSVQRLAITPDGRYLVSASSDTTALVWDLQKAKRRSPATATTLAAHLTNLQGTNGEDVHAAQWALRADPTAGLRFLRDQEALWQPTDAKKIAGWITALDSDRFAVRENATKELHAVLDEAEPHLRQALTAKGSTEYRQRIEQLLEVRKRGRTGRELQRLRVLEVLEYLAKDGEEKNLTDAKELLQRLPKAFPETLVAQEANAALKRLQKR